jgi:hypothetical protein
MDTRTERRHNGTYRLYYRLCGSKTNKEKRGFLGVGGVDVAVRVSLLFVSRAATTLSTTHTHTHTPYQTHARVFSAGMCVSNTTSESSYVGERRKRERRGRKLSPPHRMTRSTDAREDATDDDGRGAPRPPPPSHPTRDRGVKHPVAVPLLISRTPLPPPPLYLKSGCCCCCCCCRCSG